MRFLFTWTALAAAALVYVLVAALAYGSSNASNIVHVATDLTCSEDPYASPVRVHSTWQRGSTPSTSGTPTDANEIQQRSGDVQIIVDNQGPRILIGKSRWVHAPFINPLVVGLQVDQGSMSGISLTLQQWLACASSQDSDGVRRLLTKHGELMIFQAGDPWQVRESAAGWLLETDGKHPIQPQFNLDLVRKLPDGRIVAVVAEPAAPNADPLFGRPASIWFFAYDGNRWLIDLIIGGLYESPNVAATPTRITIG